MAEDVGHLLVELFGDLLFGLIFLTSAASHHEVALDELTHLFLEFEDVPVGVAPYTKTLGVLVGDFLDLASDFLHVHAVYFSTNDAV